MTGHYEVSCLVYGKNVTNRKCVGYLLAMTEYYLVF